MLAGTSESHVGVTGFKPRLCSRFQRAVPGWGSRYLAWGIQVLGSRHPHGKWRTKSEVLLQTCCPALPRWLCAVEEWTNEWKLSPISPFPFLFSLMSPHVYTNCTVRTHRLHSAFVWRVFWGWDGCARTGCAWFWSMKKSCTVPKTENAFKPDPCWTSLQVFFFFMGSWMDFDPDKWRNGTFLDSL